MSAQGTFRFYSVERHTILLVNAELLGRERVKGRFNPQFNRAGNPEGVAGFNMQTELYPYIKYRSKSPTSSTFSFNRLSNSNVQVLTICLGL